MKYFPGLLAALLVLSAAACGPERPQVLGRLRSSAEAPILEPAGARERAEELAGGDVVVRGRVTEVCPTLGCWMEIDVEIDGPRTGLRVELLGFTIDRGRLGDTCRVEGKLVEKNGRWTLLAYGLAFDD